MTKRNQRLCAREGCRRPVKDPARQHCTFLCGIADHELDRAQRICEATGDSSHWVVAVTMADAITDYHRSDSRAYRAAIKAGFADEQWQRIKHGQ